MDAVSLIIALAVLLLLSAFCSASETAYSTMNMIRMKHLAASGNKKAARAIKLAGEYDRLISAVLIGNNIVNILASSLATVLFVGYFGNLGVTISTVVITALVLIFGEITPKVMAKETPETFAIFSVSILRVLLVILSPLTFIFASWKKLILRVFKVTTKRAITEEELLTYVGEARQEGGINEQEENMIRSVIEFDDLQVIEICTPRVDVQAVSAEDSAEEIGGVFRDSGYSRLPVYRETVDEIIGVILQKEFHDIVEKGSRPLEEIIRPALYISKSTKISKLLRELQQKKIHMAIIVDEYGGTLGIVTIEDIVEELVGEIWDEHEDAVVEIEKLEENRYRVSGGTDLDDLFEWFTLDEEDTGSVTVGGWVVEQLHAIPKNGDAFEYKNLQVIVEEMRRNRVGSIVVTVQQPTDKSGEEV